MDPLSMTSSIITLLKLTTSLVSYLSDIRYATSDQKRLAIEATSLSSLLTALRYRVEESQTDDPWFTHVKLLGAPDGPLQQFRNLLDDMVEHAVPTTPKSRDRLLSALKWSFTKSTVDSSLQQIERLKSLIDIALSIDAFKLSQIIHKEVTQTRKLTQQVQHGMEQLHMQAEEDRKLAREIVEVVEGTGPFNELPQCPEEATSWHWVVVADQSGFSRLESLDIISPMAFWQTSVISTGSKVISNDNIPISGLWEDCAKVRDQCVTVEIGSQIEQANSATALEHVLQTATSRPSETVVTYFYFDFNDLGKQRFQDAARSLLFQFALQVPNGLQALQQLYRECDNGCQQPASDRVQLLLYTLIEQTKQNYLILDALDECSDQDELFNFLEELTTSSQRKVSILATSRPERYINLSLQPLVNQAIDIQSAVVDPDINAYVRSRLNVDKKLQKWSASVKDEIAMELLERADGMFQWAYCQLQSLRRCVQLRDLRRTLSTLPRSLDETYARMIHSIKADGYLSSAITILQWLCFSGRPLQLSELIDALAIEREEDDDKNNGFDPKERLPDPYDVMTICSTLISHYVSANKDGPDNAPEKEGNDRMLKTDFMTKARSTPKEVTWIRLAHFSVKEYLLSDRCSLRSSFQEATCHAALSESCLYYLRYVSQQKILTEMIVNAYPLATYAALFWWRHAQKAGEMPSMQTVDLVYSFLTTQDNMLLWFQFERLNMPRYTQDFPLDFKSFDPPLCYAASLGLVEVVRKLIAHGADVNAKTELGRTAFYSASYYGHEKTVGIMINAGADVDAIGGYHGAALSIASLEGHDKVVQILVDAGADLNAQEGYAIYLASLQGHEKVVRILVDAGADVNLQGEGHGPALHIASLYSHEQIMHILIDAGANLNTMGARGTALSTVLSGSDQKTVQILFDARADSNEIPLSVLD